MGNNDQGSVAARPWARSLGVVALAVPVVAYFWFIGAYAVNVIYYDSWSDIFLIANDSSLWAQHNENRLLFPNILVLLQSDTTHFNIVFEEFLSGAMLVAAAGLFIGAHKRRSPSTPWLYYCPVLLVMLSFVQAGNTLWGFQLAWYLVMLALAATIFIVDRPTLTRIEIARGDRRRCCRKFFFATGALDLARRSGAPVASASLERVLVRLERIRRRNRGSLLLWLRLCIVQFQHVVFVEQPDRGPQDLYLCHRCCVRRKDRG